MPLAPAQIRAIVFDYGNTLIPFNETHLRAYGASLAETLTALYTPPDEAKYTAFRQQSRRTPFEGDQPSYRENDLVDVTRRLVRELYDVEATKADLDTLLQARFDSFVAVVEGDDAVLPVLQRLAARYPLGLLSNYPDGPAIRASLKKIGMAPHFQSVVVSGDVGYCKPHPITFATSLQELGLTAQEVLFVGDNWLADVQGAKRVGMPMVQVRRWRPPEDWQAGPGDHEPDAVMGDVSELEALLSVE